SGAPMFGVFNDYEQQLLKEWIVGDANAGEPPPRPFRLQQALRANRPKPALQHSARPRPILRDRFSRRREPAPFDPELREVEDRLRDCADHDDFMRVLLPLLHPAKHASAAGLMATRIYKQML